ncbi:uncharacterized protein GGS22DRAFT_27919 [Annulohypoxylon maeteangense]|uniref:uncharacterized protein n=1 Tax=Annulohypoxylon maeteangense TaxID=1927788 RepID=UPI002008E484|nr:uncharacterized protein GGS22DRAFT_27919 [Annulohypoxylon maeteangense]KAI0883938.1 hypothetical protein GGS22DRAFT_27919 [Annulohypoxylon maeteangense]
MAMVVSESTSISTSTDHDQPLTVAPGSRCLVCLNLSQNIVDEPNPVYYDEYKTSVWGPGGFSLVNRNQRHRSPSQCQCIEKSKSLGCNFCGFLSGIIDTFIPHRKDTIEIHT